MRLLYTSGSWEPCISAFIESRLQPSDGFIDVGANVGYYSLLASRIIGPSGAVVAIEPAPDIHNELITNIGINGATNVRAVQAAVTAEPGEVRLFVPHAGNLGATTMVRPQQHEAELLVAGRPLAEVVTVNELRRARIIKIDVEGAEGVVLQSLAPHLDVLRPDCEIVVEVSPDRLAATGSSVDQALAPFFEHGLHPYSLVNSYMAEDYPVLLRKPPKPRRISKTIEQQTDIVLSPLDSEVLV